MNRLRGNIPQQVVRLGLRCNAKCLFCNVPPCSDEPAGAALAVRAIDSASANGGRARISLSGGEPTLYPELGRLIAYARQKGVEVELQTNGLRLAARKPVDRLVRCGLTHAFVSLHSHIPKIHDFLTGVPGSWSACAAAVKNLVESGVETTLNPVLTTVNGKGLADYIRFAGRILGVKSISLSVVQPRGLAFKNRALVPDYRALQAPVRAALKAALKEGVAVRNPVCGLPLCIGGWYKFPESCVEYSLGKLGLPFTAAKEKTTGCTRCFASAYCAGVWYEYCLIHGDKALKPLSKKDFHG